MPGAQAIDGGDDRSAGLGGITGLIAVHGVAFLATLPGGGGVVVDHVGRLGERASGEVGAKCAGLDDGDRDAERGKLTAQRPTEPFDGGFGCGVIAGSHRGQLSTDRGDVDDGPAAAGAHARQDRLDHRDRPEEVRFKQGANIGVVTFFDGSAVTVSGVVDQDVDTAEPLLGLLYGRDDLVGPGDVKRDGEHPLGCGLGQIGNTADVACGDDRVVAGADDSVGERAAQPGGAAGDKPGGHRQCVLPIKASRQLFALDLKYG